MMSATEPVRRRESRARPHVDAVRIAGAHRGRAHRTGQIVDLWVAERRLSLVLVDESVSQPTCVPTGKRLGDNGFGELRILECGTVHRAAARFVGQQERGAELRCDRTGMITRLTSSAVISPPAAITGTRPALNAANSWSSGSDAAPPTGRTSRDVRLPPGPVPPSRRRRIDGGLRLATVVTVPTVTMPASRSCLHSSVLGTPKVNDATSGRRSNNTSSFAAQSSSNRDHRAQPRSAPPQAPAPRRSLDCLRRGRTGLRREQIGADGPGRELARRGDPLGECFRVR